MQQASAPPPLDSGHPSSIKQQRVPAFQLHIAKLSSSPNLSWTEVVYSQMGHTPPPANQANNNLKLTRVRHSSAPACPNHNNYQIKDQYQPTELQSAAQVIIFTSQVIILHYLALTNRFITLQEKISQNVTNSVRPQESIQPPPNQSVKTSTTYNIHLKLYQWTFSKVNLC